MEGKDKSIFNFYDGSTVPEFLPILTETTNHSHCERCKLTSSEVLSFFIKFLHLQKLKFSNTTILFFNCRTTTDYETMGFLSFAQLVLVFVLDGSLVA